LLTDFISETNADRQNFVKRNRNVAGISDCTVGVESAEKGGALITANIADSYNRDIFAFPGKTCDKYSKGCNLLIKNKKAALVASADDIFREMNWSDTPEPIRTQAVQRMLFPELKPEEQKVMDILSKAGSMQLNLLAIELDLPVSKLSVILFELEMNGLVRCKPGGMYGLL
jgi:DNA processing protein